MKKITLMPHQEQALERLKWSRGCQLLNLCPGAGKTLTALTHVGQLKNVLIVCPASVVGVWEEECRKWKFTLPQRMDMTKTKREKVYQEWHVGWMTMSYETLRTDIKKIASLPWDAMILDESHKAKAPTAKVSKALRKFAKQVPQRILLSGTPLVNGWGDIWNQVEIVSPGSMYGNFYLFRNRHAIMPIPNVPAIKGWRDVDKIKEMIKPHVFTINKEIIQANLPDVSMVDVPVKLSDKEQKAYIKARDEFLIELETGEEITIATALVKVGRLRQLANGLFTFGWDISSKAQALNDILAPLQDEKVIVFSMYAETIKFLQKQLRCKHIITGESRNRDDIIADWRARGTVLLGTQAMSTGLNLQDAHYVIQIDPPWTQAEEDQRIARAWRTGQKNPVTVYNLLAEDTIDYGVRSLIKKKGSMATEMAAVTMGDLRDIL